MRLRTSSHLRGLLRIEPADAGLFALVMAIVGLMIVPLPTWLLDLLLASNLALAMLMLITALRISHGVAFSTLPTVLLITTLYRLALNVSSTRLILLQADAGRVIRAFGEFVVQGNYAVGAVVFLIITLIQYLVVAKGGERIAEVGARFTLDALPGKQLAIDADLRASALSPDAARERRALLERESQFYGAMDGAMKFVKGDAIAGIAIAVVCFIGGTSIGVFVQGRSWADSVRVFGLLTIGDALVSQIPSLVISTAAGLVVTRVAEHGRARSLGKEIASQLLAAPQALAGTALFVLALGLVPGLPALPFVLLAIGLASAAFLTQRASDLRANAARKTPPRGRVQLDLGRAPSEPDRVRLERALARVADSCSQRLGLSSPSVAVAFDGALEPDAFTLRLREAPVLRGHVLTVSELVTRIELEFARTFARHARELLDVHDVQTRLDESALRTPQLARSVVPKAMSLTSLTGLLRQLLDESVSLQAWDRILEAVCSAAEHPQHQQLERVRRALREQIIHDSHLRELGVHRLDPLIEDAVREAIVTRGAERSLALAPNLARDIVGAVRLALSEDATASLLTQTDIRRFVYELLASELPQVRVLSYDEIPPATPLDEREPIRV
jgi:type III secretion protein V